MRKALLAGMGFLLCGVIAAREKAEPIVFVFLRVDRDQRVAYLRPMVAPDIGIHLDSGASKIDPGTVLRCEPSTHAQSAIVEGQLASVSELVLACGDQKFLVRGLDFSRYAR